MNFANVFFFGQYGQPDRMKTCAEDRQGVWRNFSGSFIPEPKLIDGVLVCAPGDLIERLGSSAVAARIEAVRSGRESTEDRGVQAVAKPLSRVPAGAEDGPETEGPAELRDAQNGMRTWAKQWGSKRWHALKITPQAGDSTVSLCGRQIHVTRQGAVPGWHVACSACLHVIHRKRIKRRGYQDAL